MTVKVSVTGPVYEVQDVLQSLRLSHYQATTTPLRYAPDNREEVQCDVTVETTPRPDTAFHFDVEGLSLIDQMNFHQAADRALDDASNRANLPAWVQCLLNDLLEAEGDGEDHPYDFDEDELFEDGDDE